MMNQKAKNTKFLFILICLLSAYSIFPVPGFANSTSEESSQTALALKQAKTVRYDRERKTFDLNPQNQEYFQLQRDHLRGIYIDLTQKYFEMDHVIQRLLLARMMKTHAFLYGDPGGAKSAIARKILSIPSQELAQTPEGQLTIRRAEEVFSLQLHQMTSDVAIKGYADFEKGKNSPSTNSMRDLIRDEGTLVYFENALLDEVDKGNPVALAALLDVLNEKIAQHGPVTLKVRTQTVICTSNMTLYEFLKVFADQGMESTARALLDRLPFKVFVHNYITHPRLRDLYSKRVAEEQELRSLNSLANPFEYSSELEEVRANSDSMDDVDFNFLQALVLNPGTVSSQVSEDNAEELRSVTDTIIDEMRSKFHHRRMASEVESLNNFEEHRPVYYPPSICSTRNSGIYYRTMALSVYLDLLLLPEEKMPTSTLIQMVQKGLPLDIYSTWRLQDVLLTAAPGDPQLVFTRAEDGQSLPTLKYGEELAELRKSIFDKRQEFLLQFIAEERQDFKQVWEGVISRTTRLNHKAAGILAEILKTPSDQANPSIEVFIQEMKGDRS